MPDQNQNRGVYARVKDKALEEEAERDDMIAKFKIKFPNAIITFPDPIVEHYEHTIKTQIEDAALELEKIAEEQEAERIAADEAEAKKAAEKAARKEELEAELKALDES